MSAHRTTVTLVLGGLLAWLPADRVDDTLGGVSILPPAYAQTDASTTPVYVPPRRGAPDSSMRIGGATRGHVGQDMPALVVLAPDHTGLTISEEPSLLWFLSTPTSLRLEFTLVDPRVTRPVVEVELPRPPQAGIQRIRLADHRARLEPGVQYRWFVAAVADPDRRSRDILAGGAIERVEAPPTVRDRLRSVGPARVAFVYAEAGLWYDCIAALSDLIDARPQDVALRKQRAVLLEQIGLKQVADHELKSRGT